MNRYPGVLTFLIAVLYATLVAASLWSIALTRPSVFDPPRRAPFAALQAMMGTQQPVGQADCWSDWYSGWEAQTQWCWYPAYTLTVEHGIVTRVYGRGIEGVRVGDVLLVYGYPTRVQQFGAITALWYPGMVVYALGDRALTPDSRVYSVSIREGG